MITLECNYQKKLGLPGYSSHQFSITLRTEIADVNQVQAESARLYKLLQEGVDTSIKETGYLLQTAVEKCGGWRSNSAAPGGSKLLQGGGVKFDNLRRFDCELKRAGGRAASLQLAPPGVEWSFVSGCRLRSV
jgi:hypothetical protein